MLYPGAGPGVTAPGFRDITSGSNGAYAAAPGGDPASGLGSPGWDPASGLGSPDGTALLARLQSPASPDDPMD